ncbi:ribonuclease domain-containing protein [Cognatiluteimonas weifangensis]|uniref:Ribonuclease n=1 Tax=Cognatiluteimonas weifangensis TaxID=2303539 RepID=A0A372DPL6_9GAMM|nr:ribonuclease domain-containing protein [Luteimonas weifangensis]RFP61469.1 ribonuclease [Luteimonas weifangensis]
MRRYAWMVVALALAAWWLGPPRAPTAASAPTLPVATEAPTARTPWPADLPPEALATLQRIQRGGPFPHRQDGGTFGNRERLLPPQPRGYYREYTVATPGAHDRGARRIVAGGDPPVEFFYSADHYRSFRRIAAPAHRDAGGAP